MKRHKLSSEARSLEEAFFEHENAKLLEKLREQDQREEQRAALRTVVKDADDALLDHLLELGIGPETALAVMLVPLAVVAWADGSIDDKEREAILQAAEERGVTSGSAARELLVSWLDTKPGPELVEMWRRYVRSVSAALEAVESEELRSRILGLARGVAETAGGFLGLGNKISPAEQAALDDIAATLG